jgi:peptidoglycan/xylan/chitin deacetylase (PgdA/CDA1 family)
MLKDLKTLAKPLIKRAVITAGLEASVLLDRFVAGERGHGAIFTLHHVRPKSDASFQPNDILEITPEFLDTAITTLKGMGYEFIRLEDVPERLQAPESPPFACFTLDDGYRDNAEFAAPVFSRHGVPFTIFLTKGFIEGTHSAWWETLEVMLNKVDRLTFDFGNGPETLPASSFVQKLAAFDRLSHFINTGDEAAAIARVDAAAHNIGIDPIGLARILTMPEDELKRLLANPLVSYGAHTLSHRGLSRLSLQEAVQEITDSAARVAVVTGIPPKSFAYPYGDQRSVSTREQDIIRSLGLIGVTTRPGTLKRSHATDMTAIPRISLNGLYQKARYVRALASGIPFRAMR